MSENKIVVLQLEDAKEIAEGIADIINYTVGIDSDKSGKVETDELFAFLGKVANAVFTKFGFIPTAWDQIKSADGEGRAMIIEAFAGKFDLENDVAEFLVEDWMLHINQTAMLIKRTSVLIKKKEEPTPPTV